MSKVNIDANETWPDYSLNEDGIEIEATAAQIARWSKAADLYADAQREMGELYEAAAAAEREREARVRAERETKAKAERDRVAREREAEAQRAKKQEDAMWERIEASGGVVYDAEGKRIGTVRDAAGYPGVRLEP